MYKTSRNNNTNIIIQAQRLLFLENMGIQGGVGRTELS